MKTVRIFKYIQELDAFLVTDQYRDFAEKLGLIEWHPVVWIGRLFAQDNDFGEHWFDNWDEREVLRASAQELGFSCEELMVIVPDRFINNQNGPCHPPDLRKKFWADVLKSLELSYDTIFDEARYFNQLAEARLSDLFIEDLEDRIAEIQAAL